VVGSELKSQEAGRLGARINPLHITVRLRGLLKEDRGDGQWISLMPSKVNGSEISAQGSILVHLIKRHDNTIIAEDLDMHQGPIVEVKHMVQHPRSDSLVPLFATLFDSLVL
jgi:hypothetical protein